MKLFRAIWTQLWATAVLLMVLLALYVSLGRQLMPTLSSWQPEVETWLSELLKQPVSLASLQGDWSGLSPTVRLQDLNIAGQEGIHIQTLELELDVVSSLINWLPVFHQINVRGVRTKLEQVSQHEWQIAPNWVITLPQKSTNTQAKPSTSQPPWAKLLSLQNSIVFFDWQLEFKELGSEPDHIQINEFDWRSHDLQHSLDISMAWGREEIANIRLQGFLEGELWPWDNQFGHIYVSVDEQEWSRWIPKDALPKFQVESLRAAVEGWLSIHDGNLFKIYLNAKLPQFILHTPGETMTVQGGLVQVAGQHQGDDWHLRLRPQFDTPLPFDSISLSQIALPNRTGWQLGVPRIDVTQLQQILERYALLPEFIAPYFDETQPQGEASDLRVAVLPPQDDSEHWKVDIRTKVHQINTKAFHGIPALEDVDGELHIQPHAGAFYVKDDFIRVHLSQLYQPIWHINHPQGAFRWLIYPDHAKLVLDNFSGELQDKLAENPQAWPVKAGMEITLPRFHNEVEPSLSLLLAMPQGPVFLQQQLVPDLAGDKLQQWLDHSLLGGDASNVVYALQIALGPEHPPHTMSSLLSLDFNDAALKYLPEWPEVYQLAGHLNLQGSNLDITVKSAETLGGAISGPSHVSLRADGEHHNRLTIQAQLAGDSADAIAYFTDTPLHELVQGALDHWRAQGDMQANLGLSLLLGADSIDPKVSIDAKLHNNELFLDDLQLAFHKLSGDFHYDSEQGLSAKSIEAETFSGKVQAQLTSSFGDNHFRLQLQGRGKALWQDIKQWQPLFLYEPLHGELDYDLKMVVDRGFELELSSDLYGTSLALPAPYGKQSMEMRPTLLQVKKADKLAVSVNYDQIIDAKLEFNNEGVERGQVEIGGQTAVLTDAPGIYVNGLVEPEVEAKEWWETWQMFTAASQVQKQNVAYLENRNPIRQVALTLHQADAWGVPMGPTQILAKQAEDYWSVQLDSDLLKGTVDIPNDAEVMAIDLDYLHFPASQPSSDASDFKLNDEISVRAEDDMLREVEPSRLPAFDMKLGEVFVGGRNYGRWQFQSRPTANGLAIHLLDTDLYGMNIVGDLHWQEEDQAHRTRLENIEIKSSDVAKIQHGFRMTPVVTGKKLTSSLDLSWVGSPLAFNLQTLNGNMAVKINDGSLATDSASALKAFGAFNIKSLSRRLKLDFSDLYESGLAFDVLQAKMDFSEGVLTLSEPMLLDGPGGKFLTSGESDMLGHELNMKIAVTFPVSGNLPLMAILAGIAPPVAASIYVTEKLIGDELSRFTSASYSLTGTWEEPEMKINKLFDDKVEGKKSRSFKDRFKSIFGG
ncbi:MAG: YhdP family protein [Venatoribacter sp.]